MGAARIAPGLALLLCCPVLSSAYALVSLSPSTFKHKNPGVALGSLGECRRKDLGSPNSLNFGMVPPPLRRCEPGILVPALVGVS